jgi:hypothetical protein
MKDEIVDDDENVEKKNNIRYLGTYTMLPKFGPWLTV